VRVIKVITIEREYGSGGGGIAAKLASQLGWTLWDGAITTEIARRLKCSVSLVEEREERLDPTFYRLIKAFMRGSYEESFHGHNADLLDAEHLARLFESVVTEAAMKGNAVIVGRGSPWYLRERTDAFHTFIYAPHTEKIRRLLEMGKDREEAEHLIQTVDTERGAFVKRFHGKTWPQRDLYNLMVNSKMGDDVVIELILNTITRLSQPTPALVGAGVTS
jgi:cytidylate kinase